MLSTPNWKVKTLSTSAKRSVSGVPRCVLIKLVTSTVWCVYPETKWIAEIRLEGIQQDVRREHAESSRTAHQNVHASLLVQGGRGEVERAWREECPGPVPDEYVKAKHCGHYRRRDREALREHMAAGSLCIGHRGCRTAWGRRHRVAVHWASRAGLKRECPLASELIGSRPTGKTGIETSVRNQAGHRRRGQRAHQRCRKPYGFELEPSCHESFSVCVFSSYGIRLIR